MKARISSLLRKAYRPILPLPRGGNSSEGVSVLELLTEMDDYDWAPLDDIAIIGSESIELVAPIGQKGEVSDNEARVPAE